MNILKVLTPERKTGNLGENAAVWYLRLRGYRILERNYSAKNAEIDIIASKKNITAFIEVKTRNIKNIGSFESRPAAAVTSEKQRKIIKVAEHYRSRNPSKTRMRFDIIEVYVEDKKRGIAIKEIKHLEASFNKDTAFDAKYFYKRKKEGSNL